MVRKELLKHIGEGVTREELATALKVTEHIVSRSISFIEHAPFKISDFEATMVSGIAIRAGKVGNLLCDVIAKCEEERQREQG